MNSPDVELRCARQVVKDLENVLIELGRSALNSSDFQVQQLADASHKAARKALRRAKLVLKDLDLRNAAQPDLLANQGE